MPPRILESEKDKVEIEKKLVQFYRSPDDKYRFNYDEDTYEAYADSISMHIKSNDKVLDIGSGTERFLVKIAKKSAMVFSCDYSFDSNGYAQVSKSSENPFYLVSGSGTALPFKQSTFDVVTTSSVLEHIVYVDRFLLEVDKVLKKNGILIIKCPNWIGFNAPIKAIVSLTLKKKRYWQYDNLRDAFLWLSFPIVWYLKIFFSKETKFVLVFPKIQDEKVDFKESDDDCVHLCHPFSFKKWLRKHNYKILQYNRYQGRTMAARIFNTFFPSFSTTNHIVAKKK